MLISSKWFVCNSLMKRYKEIVNTLRAIEIDIFECVISFCLDKMQLQYVGTKCFIPLTLYRTIDTILQYLEKKKPI